MAESPITVTHNLDPSKFVYLWMKYVRDVNLEKHCTNCLHGAYSKKLSKRNNPSLRNQSVLTLDEVPLGGCRAIYICGVSSNGYRDRPKNNYPHNLHLALIPQRGAHGTHRFEQWSFEVVNGQISRIPAKDELPPPWSSLPDEYTTCRIFRWAVVNQHLFAPANR